MSERSDRKLQQVAIASYNYRHEAEFAAGFLEDAGIPYRLQIEDPALGVSVTDSATIWVAAMDERRARRVLETDSMAAPEGDERWADEDAWWTADDVERRADDADEGVERERDVWASLGRVDEAVSAGGAPDRGHGRGRAPEGRRLARAEPREGRRVRPGRTVGARPRGRSPSGRDADTSPGRRKRMSDLTLRQRAIALLGGVGIGGTLGLESVRDAPGAVAIGIAAIAGVLALVALVGRAPNVLRSILSALSGDVS